MRELMPCGTRAAYVRHLRHGEVPCENCVQANREIALQAQRDRAATTPFHLIPHGLGGYRNYCCRCETCSEAHKTALRNYRRRTGPAPGAVLLAAGLDPSDPWPPGRQLNERDGNGSTTSGGRAAGTTSTGQAATRAGREVEGEPGRAPQ